MKKIKFNLKIAVVLLSILVLVLAGYIFMEKYSAKMSRERLEVFQKGVQYGYRQVIVEVMKQASTCQPVPLYFNNQTIRIIALECFDLNQTGK